MRTGNVGRARSARTGSRGRSIRAALAVVVGLLAVVAGPASPASAHAEFVGSSPAVDSLIQEAPTQVVLTFTEAVNPVAGKVRVIAPDGSRVDRDEARPAGEQLIIPLRTITQSGTYLVTFRVISTDSHPVPGAFSFSYRVVSPGGPPSADGAGAGTSGFVLAALPVARWIGYLGLALLVGSALVLTLLWPRRLDRAAPSVAAYAGAGIVALGTVLELGLQVPYVAGGGLGDATSADLREVLSSQYGAAHLVRLGVLAAALVLLRTVARARASDADRVLLSVLGVIGVATWSISGHPSATDVATVSITADMIHLAAMSAWLGGLVILVVFLLPRANATELAAIVPVWSRWAGYAIGALLLTGVAQSLIEVRTLRGLVATTYGLTLLAKVALVGGVLAVALLSRRLVPVIAAGRVGGEPEAGNAEAEAGDAEAEAGDAEAEAGDAAAEVGDAEAEAGAVAAEEAVAQRPHANAGAAAEEAVEQRRPGGAAGRLRRLVLIEATLALVIIGITSVLVQLTPGRTAAADVEAGGVQSAVLNDPRFTLTVDLSPARVGINFLHMYATTPDGLPLDVVEWSVQASHPSGIEAIEAAVSRVTDDHARGQLGLPVAGAWTFRFTLRLDEVTNGIVTTTLTVGS